MKITSRALRLQKDLILLLILAGIFAAFSIAEPNFLRSGNIISMLNNMTVTCLLALGLTPLMIAGGIDLTFGATLSLSTVVTGLLSNKYKINLGLAMSIGFTVPILFAIANSVLIETFNLLPIILTLGMMSIAQALSLVISNGTSFLILNDTIYALASGSFLKIPYPILIMISCIIIFWLLSSKTKLGRKTYLIGSNPLFAFLSGIKVKKVRIFLYALSGIMTACAASINLCLTGVGISSSGLKLTLPVLSAVLLGGVSLRGGSGSIWGSILGVLILTIIYNGLSLLNVMSYYIQIFQGLALLIIIMSYEGKVSR